MVYSDEVEAYNLLFIGNSLTKYTYNIPNFIYEMLRADDVVVNFLLDSTTPQWIIDHEINFNFLITPKDQYAHVFLLFLPLEFNVLMPILFVVLLIGLILSLVLKSKFDYYNFLYRHSALFENLAPA